MFLGLLQLKKKRFGYICRKFQDFRKMLLLASLHSVMEGFDLAQVEVQELKFEPDLRLVRELQAPYCREEAGM